MLTAAVTFYDVVLWLHVSAVVVGFGPTFAYAVLEGVVAKSSPRSLPALLGAVQTNNRSLVTTGGVVVLVTGIYLTAVQWEFSAFFISWGIVAVLVLLGLIHAFFIPNERKAQEAAERDIAASGGGDVEFGDDFQKATKRVSAMGVVAGLIVVLTVYVMVAKPFM